MVAGTVVDRVANINNAGLGDRLEKAIARSAKSPGFRPLLIGAKAQVGDGAEPMAKLGYNPRF